MATQAKPKLDAASRFNDTLLDILDRIEYRRVDPHDFDDPIFRLRYDAYRREAFVPFNLMGTSVDDYDGTPNVHCFGVHIDGQLVSSLRIHHVSPDCRTSPIHSVYPDVLDPLLDKGCTMIDPTRFTADRDATLAFPALPFLTLRLAAMATVYYETDYCLAAVRPEHAAFYRRVFLAERMAGERHYPGLDFPIHLYAAHIPVVDSEVYRRRPFLMSTPAEREALFSPMGTGVSPLRISPTARQVRGVEGYRNARQYA
jgi:N-acyl amino acid synthase FeeM